jgi:hypothetical protein
MKISIESTTKIVELIVNGSPVHARVWQGATESGVPVQCFITRIAPEVAKNDPRCAELTEQFDRELTQRATPRPTVEAIPLCLII